MKTRWSLTIDQAERAGLGKIIAECPASRTSVEKAGIVLANGDTHGPNIPESPGDTKNCPDFVTYTEAKGWFDQWFPCYGDVAGLDANNDGRPCESLPGGPG